MHVLFLQILHLPDNKELTDILERDIDAGLEINDDLNTV